MRRRLQAGLALRALGRRSGPRLYFHPFVLPQGYGDANLAGAWQRAHREVPFADLVSFQPHLCVHGRAPKQAATPEFAAVANYGYHLDAGKFGVFLREHCVEQAGRAPSWRTTSRTSAPRTTATSPRCGLRGGGVVEGDLFVDCTGMQSLLLGKHYGVPLLHQRHVLFNDSALAVQVPYAREDSPIASQTTSTAQPNGWIWDIGLPTRRGIGHVYSSAHSSDEMPSACCAPTSPHRRPGRHPGAAQAQLRTRLPRALLAPQRASRSACRPASSSRSRPRRWRWWNCRPPGWPTTCRPRARRWTSVAARFNEAFTYRWERVIDFLKLHYVLSRRSDSAYWIEHREPRRFRSACRNC
jgi:tryptophan halogenase